MTWRDWNIAIAAGVPASLLLGVVLIVWVFG